MVSLRDLASLGLPVNTTEGNPWFPSVTSFPSKRRRGSYTALPFFSAFVISRCRDFATNRLFEP